jgi:hypothetical protein
MRELGLSVTVAVQHHFRKLLFIERPLLAGLQVLYRRLAERSGKPSLNGRYSQQTR